MVNGPASRFSWAFNDVSFSDVQLVLRANKAHADCSNTHGSAFSSYDCHRRAPGIGSDQRDAADYTARRGCEGTSTQCQMDARNVSHLNASLCQGGKPAWPPRPQKTEIRIHAHSIILASCSEMMRSWLSRWSEEHADEDPDVADKDSLQCKQRDRRRRRLALRLEVDLAPEELAAGEAVVRFMYTQSLDGVEDDEELLHCMLLADRWLLPDCVAACAARLQSVPAGSLCWRVRAALLALPLGLSAASPHVAQLQARAEASIMRTFRCPEMILEEPENRLLLLSLPPDRMEQLLLGRQDLQVTSENVVLALLSAWLEHNYPHLVDGSSGSSSCLGCGGGPGATASCGCAPGQQEHQIGCTHHHEADRGTAWDDCGGGGAASQAAGPPAVEALVRLIRYGDLTPHYRTAVAPSLPVLRGLRLHHHLLAETCALYGDGPAAPTRAPPGDRPPAARGSTIESYPPPPAQAPEPAKGVPSAAAAASSGSGTTTLSRSGSLTEYDTAKSAASLDKLATTDKTCEGKGAAASSGVAAAAAALSRSSSDATSEKQAMMEVGGRSSGGREVEAGDAVQQQAAASSGVGGQQAAAETAAAATDLSAAAAGAVPQSSKSAADAAAVVSTAVVEVAPPVPPRLPRRLPYSSFRRIEWSRDIRDVRLHLTGVGGPMVGGEAAAGLQLSPPLFLGGYNWHVATRFVPAGVAAPGATAAPTYATAAAATAAGLSPSASAGRLQLQLGVICTAPGADCSAPGAPSLLDIQRQQLLQLQQGPGTAGSSYPAVDEPSSSGGAAAADEVWSLLEIANCTLGILDAAGRTAWQVVQAPCMLQPGQGGSSNGGASSPVSGSSSSSGWGSCDGGAPQGGVRGRVGGAGSGRWEFWSGLSGLEATWWESGSALTAGGVLRVRCSLTLQA